MIANFGKSLALVAATIVCMLVVLYGSAVPPLRAVAASLLVLVLPGYAFTRAAFPARAWGGPERLMFSLGGSLSLAVVSGLALNWTRWGLQITSWTIFLGVMALLATVVATIRQPVDPIVRPQLTLPPIQNIVLLILSVVLIVGGYGVAAYGARERPAAAFTQLWLLPDDDERQTVQLGILNHEGDDMTYRLVLRAGVEVVQEWPAITLADNEQWEMEIGLAAETTDQDLVASLYRNDQPNAVYRYVTLRAQG